jgi:pyruvate ferredoxin oxidoreductase gamma subunit
LMKEIRIHGRGGQGSVVTAEILAIAAFEDGKFSQAFPYLGGGGDRRGAPVQAFLRISDRPIRLHSKIHDPDYVIVQDPTLVKEVEVGKGLKPGGLLIVNSEKAPQDLGLTSGIRTVAVPATRIALEVIGRPIMNTALMGAFSAISQEVSLPAVLRAIRTKFPGEVGEKNALAAQKMFEHLKGKESA